VKLDDHEQASIKGNIVTTKAASRTPRAGEATDAPAATLAQPKTNRRWYALAVLSASLMLIVIDGTIVNIAFPSIRATFNAPFSQAEWVNSIYSLIFGAALITWGRLGDQYGRKNIFIGGTALFALSSLGVGLAPSIQAMIGFRALQGLAAAMMSPSTLSIISSTFRGRERGIAFGVWGATAGLSAALGPLLGGWLIEYGTNIVHESWRLGFLINVPFAAFAIVLSIWAIHESRDTIQKHQIDWAGIVLATLGIGAIVWGTIEGQTQGWLYDKRVFLLGPVHYPQPRSQAVLAATPFIFAFGMFCLALFIWWERRVEKRGGEPLFELSLFRYRSFRFGLLTIFIVALSEYGTFLSLAIYFQLAKGLGAFETGLKFLPFALMTMFAAPLGGIVSSRIGAKWVVAAGMFCEAIALYWISRVLYVDVADSALSVPLLLYGLGIGLAIAQLSNLVLSDIPSDKAGQGSGAANTTRQLGATLGIAIIGAVLFTGFATAAIPLVQKSTAFEDFGARITASTTLSPSSKLVGSIVTGFGTPAKQGIIKGLAANEGFDANQFDLILFAADVLNSIPSQMQINLRAQGIDLRNPATLEQIRADLAPDVNILKHDIQYALGTGFSEAARASSLLASALVLFGALSSLLLPNAKPHRRTHSSAPDTMQDGG
jgi:MFS family permease